MAERAQDRRALRKEQRRTDILDAAEEAFVERGFHETGIADIAKTLGLGHGTFYRYFDNKRDIAIRVIDRAIEDFAAVGLRADPFAPNTLGEYRDQVETMVSGWLDYAAQNPRPIRMLFEQAHLIDVDRLTRLTEAYVEFTAAFLENGIRKGFLRQDLEVRATAEVLLGVIIAGCRKAVLTTDQAERERWARAAISLMFDGVRAG